MDKPFVVISGLPGSGKTTLARRLAPALSLPLIDKDDILEQLVAARGIGNAESRQALSRECDTIMQAQATSSPGAVLVSFWHQPGMADESGTPTGWLPSLSPLIVNVHCLCASETAAARFMLRGRHPGHRDYAASYHDVLSSLRRLATLNDLEIGPRLYVDTSDDELNVTALAEDVRTMLGARMERATMPDTIRTGAAMFEEPLILPQDGTAAGIRSGAGRHRL